MDSDHENAEAFTAIPTYMLRSPLLNDKTETSTTKSQAKTIQECLPLLSAANHPTSNPFDFNECGVPYLNKDAHTQFIANGLENLPSQFVAMDASRPWLMYWSMLSLYIIGEDVTHFKPSIMKTFAPLQNTSGGFGGGQGHDSHLACTYAVILAIAIVGDGEAYEIINRRALYHWLGRLKAANGGFHICENGEIDVRGAYCALVAITLLGLPFELPKDSPARAHGLSDFRDGLGSHLSQCQTFEGGIAAAPGYEAHGAYTFCALACLCVMDEPQVTLNKYLDIDRLLRWLSARQYAPEGGFAGRTNKVVDGCYSHWIGGCWPLVEAALEGPGDPNAVSGAHSKRLFDAEGLTRYILCCCQAPNGGLRDKPSKRPDAYHTCYNLAGLSMASHRHHYNRRRSSTGGLLTWQTTIHGVFEQLGETQVDEEETVAAIEPVFVIPHEAVSRLHQWSLDNPV